MAWTKNLTNLRDVLADLFPFQKDSVEIVRDATLPLDQIRWDEKSSVNWSNILAEADKLSKVNNIILAALKKYPDNPVLMGILSPQSLERQQIPELPPYYLPREEDLARLRGLVLNPGNRKVGLSASGKIGVQGMGGIGKTVLAAALAKDPQVQSHFTEGVYWVTLGQEPNLLALQGSLGQRLGDQRPYSDINQGKKQLMTKP